MHWATTLLIYNIIQEVIYLKIMQNGLALLNRNRVADGNDETLVGTRL